MCNGNKKKRQDITHDWLIGVSIALPDLLGSVNVHFGEWKVFTRDKFVFVANRFVSSHLQGGMPDAITYLGKVCPPQELAADVI